MYKELKQINRRPIPFEYYTAEELWTDEHTSKQMLAYHLNEQVGAASRDKQFIERFVRGAKVTGMLSARLTFISVLTVFIFILFFLNQEVHAEIGARISLNTEHLSYSKFDEPSPGFENSEIKLESETIKISYPKAYSNGKTLLTNELQFKHYTLKYRNIPGNTIMPDDFYDIKYTFMFKHRMNDDWSFLTLLMPGIASDLEGSLSGDDYNYQTIAAFYRHFSPEFSLGFGVVYSTISGEPLPIPAIAIEWDNGSNMKFSAILPAEAEFWHTASPAIDLGLKATIEGNEFYGDPDIYKVDDPRMKYSILKVGPAVKVNLSKGVILNVEGGWYGNNRYEFYDGDDKAGTYDMEAGYYINAGIEFGI
jgi:hypothetical protein